MGLMQASGLTLSPPLGVLHPNARGSIGLAVVSPGRGEQVAAGGGAGAGFLPVTWTIVCADARRECCVSALPIVSINCALQPAGRQLAGGDAAGLLHDEDDYLLMCSSARSDTNFVFAASKPAGQAVPWAEVRGAAAAAGAGRAGGVADKPGASRIELEVMLVDRTGELIAAEASHFFV